MKRASFLEMGLGVTCVAGLFGLLIGQAYFGTELQTFDSAHINIPTTKPPYIQGSAHALASVVEDKGNLVEPAAPEPTHIAILTTLDQRLLAYLTALRSDDHETLDELYLYPSFRDRISRRALGETLLPIAQKKVQWDYNHAEAATAILVDWNDYYIVFKKVSGVWKVSGFFGGGAE